MRNFLAFLLLAGFTAAAAAQMRSIPADAKRASMRHVQDMAIQIDGRAMLLTPGAQIRDTFNRLVVPSAVAGTVTVRYLTDASGQQVHRVWILSPEEAAQSAPPPTPPKDEQKAAGS